MSAGLCTSSSVPVRVEEPYIRATTIVPKEYVGTVMELNNDRRGRFHHMEYLSEQRVLLAYDLPLADVVYDYYDQLKSRTKGYASFDYDVVGFEQGDLVRLDVLLAGEPVDALSLVVHRTGAHSRGKALVERLKEEIPRQLFDVAGRASSRARRSRRNGRTFSPSVTAATSHASAS
jgi:GTP-binding protein LepA